MNFDEMLKTPDASTKVERASAQRGGPVIGGLPQVSLLPREMRDAARGRTVRRALAGGVVVAVLVAAAGIAATTSAASTAQSRLEDANAQTQTLAAQLGQFSDVQQLQQDLDLARAAVAVGSSTEIDWDEQVAAIRQDMPYDYTITSFNADSASAIADYPQGSSPLEEPRAATVQLSITAPTITELPIWLRKMRSIPAFADATPQVNEVEDDGYTVDVVIHLSAEALVHGTPEEEQ